MHEKKQDRSERQATVLVVDDELGIRELLTLLLEAEGYRVLAVVSGEEAIKTFETERDAIDVVVQDLKMSGMGGGRLLRKLRAEAPQLPVIVVTAFSTWDDAVEAMRVGAYNYIRKPFDTDTIRRVVRGAIETRSLWVDGALSANETYREIIGNHASMQDVFSMIQRVATTDSTVLIQGESGTGKEMVARAVHFRSHRRDRPFVPVNCSAFPEALLESELFGHVKGSFTGAIEDKKGLFRVAAGGTIFLDEVGDMSLSTQVKLLRVLEERKISPVGSTKLEPIDVRIVAATNKVMEDEVLKENFREDLFYRLNVIPLFLPALRERKDDIPLLVGHFLAKYSKRMSKNITGISDAALRRICEHSWPGNVRELENIIQRHVALCDGETISEVEVGGRGLQQRGLRKPSVSSENSEKKQLIPPEGLNLENELEELERRYLHEALRRTGGHLTNAAKLLEMSYRSIRYRVKKLHVREDVEA